MSDSHSDDFATTYESVFGDFDPRVDYIGASNGANHHEQLWVADYGHQVKVPPRSLFMCDKIVASPSNKLRNRNDLVRDAIVRQYHWRYTQEKDAGNLVLASEIELELRELGLQNKMAQALRMKADDENRRSNIIDLLSGPYEMSMDMLAEEQIDALRNDAFRIECMRKLEDFRRRK